MLSCSRRLVASDQAAVVVECRCREGVRMSASRSGAPGRAELERQLGIFAEASNCSSWAPAAARHGHPHHGPSGAPRQFLSGQKKWQVGPLMDDEQPDRRPRGCLDTRSDRSASHSPFKREKCIRVRCTSECALAYTTPRRPQIAMGRVHCDIRTMSIEPVQTVRFSG
jgi:hypothetical protein